MRIADCSRRPIREPGASCQPVNYAAGRGCFLELNAHPERLDLPDSADKPATAAGGTIVCIIAG